MENKKIIRELEKNEKGNNIFGDQKSQDLNELKDILKERKDLVVDFPVKEWDMVAPYLMRKEDMTQLSATRSYVASKLLGTLKEKYPQLKKYYRSEGNPECPSLIYNLSYINDLLEIEDIHPERVHFIMNGNKSAILCDALSILLDDNNPFDVSIYSSPNVFYTSVIPDNREKEFIWEAYNYTSYKENEEGEKNIASRHKVKIK